MKHLVLLLGLLVSAPVYAQFTRTYTGSIVATDPVIPGDRLFRDGSSAVCGATKTFPGTSANSAGAHYDAYTIANRNAAPTCVTLTLTHNCAESSTASLLFLSVYTDAFNPASLATNYKSDSGGSPVAGLPRTMGVTLAPNEQIILLVSGLAAASTCSAYALDVAAPQFLPVAQALPNITGQLAAYPNPVADVLHLAPGMASSYTLFNAAGVAVRHITGTEVPMSELPGSVYLLQHNETKQVIRVVKL